MQMYSPQQPSPQPSSQLPSPGGHSPQPSLQPSGAPFVKQEVTTREYLSDTGKKESHHICIFHITFLSFLTNLDELCY